MKTSRALWFFALALAIAALAPRIAEAAPAVSIAVSPATGVAPYAATLTWNSTGATSCTASDGWSGAQATSGTKAVTISAATKFTLTCVASDGQVTITWTAPTQNTDGSTLTDLAGFNVYRGTSATNLAKVKALGKTVTSYVDPALASGSYLYAATAVNASSVESVKSQTSSVVVVGSSTSQSAIADVTTVPNPPTGLTATSIAYEYRRATNTYAAIGLVPIGAPCGPQTRIAGTAKYCRVLLADSRPVVWPQDRALTEVWVRQ